MIEYMGSVKLNPDCIELAENIKKQNFKINTPAKYQKHKGSDPWLIRQLSLMFEELNESKIDYVYFSAKEGAEPHVDKLSLSEFNEETIIIPVILPYGKSTLIVDGQRRTLEQAKAYKFNHTKIHSLELEDTESGCVLIMAAVLK